MALPHPSKVARGLGWFSVGLGLLELAGGRQLARFLGTGDSVALVRGFGLRELAAGVGILLSPKPAAGWLWARVAGDALDIAALEEALRARGTEKANVSLSLGAVVAVTAVDIWCAYQLGRADYVETRVVRKTRA